MPVSEQKIDQWINLGQIMTKIKLRNRDYAGKKKLLWKETCNKYLCMCSILVVITIISYGQRDPSAYFVTKTMEDSLTKSEYVNIHISNATGFSKVNT